MADFDVRFYLKNGQIIEFITDEFSIKREAARSGLKLGTFVMGQADIDLLHIDQTEIVAVTKRATRR